MFDYTMKIIHMNLVIFTFLLFWGFFSLRATENIQKTLFCILHFGGLLPVLNHFSLPSLVIYFSPTPPMKVKLGLQRGGRLLNSNSKQTTLTNRQQGSIVTSYLLHSSLAGVKGFALFFASLSRLCKIARPNQFC